MCSAQKKIVKGEAVVFHVCLLPLNLSIILDGSHSYLTLLANEVHLCPGLLGLFLAQAESFNVTGFSDYNQHNMYSLTLQQLTPRISKAQFVLTGSLPLLRLQCVVRIDSRSDQTSVSVPFFIGCNDRNQVNVNVQFTYWFAGTWQSLLFLFQIQALHLLSECVNIESLVSGKPL